MNTKSSVYRHMAIWGLLVFYLSFSCFVEGAFASKAMYVFVTILNFCIAYYFLAFFVFPSFQNKKYLLSILCFVFCTTFFTSLDFFLFKKIIPFLGGETTLQNLSFYQSLKGSSLWFLFVSSSALATFLNRRSIERFKQNAENEKNAIIRELDFLKNQFHSHLTFNFLNFCYGKTFKESPQVADSIEAFSEMLRYSLSNKQAQYVDLEKEVDYIKNFITIQKCITNSVFVDFQVNDNLPAYKIFPMLLAVFIENAFKHGEFNDPNHPIIITLQAKQNNLLFTIKNRKTNRKIIASTGTGIFHVKELLEQFYPGKYLLQIDETEKNYFTSLNLTTN